MTDGEEDREDVRTGRIGTVVRTRPVLRRDR
jgi:hypothetical protein